MTEPRPFDKGLPTRDNCDLNNPYEQFLWCFAALPHVRGGPLIMPLDYYQLVSKHLHDLGVVLQCENCGHVKPPKLKYQPPLATDPNIWTSPGKWVPVGAPDPDPRTPAARAADSLTTAQQAELFAELGRRHTPAQRRKITADDESTPPVAVIRAYASGHLTPGERQES